MCKTKEYFGKYFLLLADVTAVVFTFSSPFTWKLFYALKNRSKKKNYFIVVKWGKKRNSGKKQGYFSSFWNNLFRLTVSNSCTQLLLRVGMVLHFFFQFFFHHCRCCSTGYLFFISFRCLFMHRWMDRWHIYTLPLYKYLLTFICFFFFCILEKLNTTCSGGRVGGGKVKKWKKNESLICRWKTVGQKMEGIERGWGKNRG